MKHFKVYYGKKYFKNGILDCAALQVLEDLLSLTVLFVIRENNYAPGALEYAVLVSSCVAAIVKIFLISELPLVLSLIRQKETLLGKLVHEVGGTHFRRELELLMLLILPVKPLHILWPGSWVQTHKHQITNSDGREL